MAGREIRDMMDSYAESSLKYINAMYNWRQIRSKQHFSPLLLSRNQESCEKAKTKKIRELDMQTTQ